MAIYLLNYISIPIYSFFIKNKRVLVTILTAQMFIILACRSETMGVDVDNYAIYYNSYSQYSLSEMVGSLSFFGNANLTYALESGYVFFNFLVGKLGYSFNEFLIVTAAITMSSVGWFIYRYSEDPGLSFAFFAAFIFGSFFGILRQSLGFAVFLFAVPALIKRDFIKYLILVYIASTFHTAFFLAVPLYFLCGLEIKTRRFIEFIVGLLVLIAIVPILFNLIINPVLSVLGRPYELAAFTWNNMFLLMLMLLILICFNYTRIPNADTLIWGCFYAVLVQALAFYVPIFSRLAIGVFFAFFCITMPNLVSNTRQFGVTNHLVDNFTSLALNRVLLYVVILGFYFFSLQTSPNVPYVTQF